MVDSTNNSVDKYLKGRKGESRELIYFMTFMNKLERFIDHGFLNSVRKTTKNDRSSSFRKLFGNISTKILLERRTHFNCLGKKTTLFKVLFSEAAKRFESVITKVEIISYFYIWNMVTLPTALVMRFSASYFSFDVEKNDALVYFKTSYTWKISRLQTVVTYVYLKTVEEVIIAILSTVDIWIFISYNICFISVIYARYVYFK